MAERKAVNKYYPPEWDPSKGSINKYVGQHPYRDRARKLDQGILIVRFELPYSVWCEGCSQHIGMGVRYNAEKKKVGNYYSTPIFTFRMKCHLCSNYIVIRTDPKNTEYVIESGARKRVEEYDPEDIGVININKPENVDAFKNLEFRERDVINSEAGQEVIRNIIKESNSKWADPYTQSRRLRKKFREEKKIYNLGEAKRNELAVKYSLPLDIPNLREEDEVIIEKMKLESAKLRRDRASNPMCRSIFKNKYTHIRNKVLKRERR